MDTNFISDIILFILVALLVLAALRFPPFSANLHNLSSHVLSLNILCIYN